MSSVGGPGGYATMGLIGGIALLAAALIPVSPLPAFAAGAILILLTSFAIRAEDLLGLLPIGVALSPALALFATQIAGGAGGLVVVGFMLLMVIAAYRVPARGSFGPSEVAVAIFALGLTIGLTHGAGVGEGSIIVRSLVPFFLAWVAGRAVARISGTGHSLWWMAALFLVINAPLGIMEALTTSDLVVFPQTGLVEIGQTGFARPNGFLSTDIDFAFSMILCVAVLVGGPSPVNRSSLMLPIALLGSVAVVLASFRTGWIVLALIWIAWLAGRSARAWVLSSAVLLVAISLLIQPVQDLAGSDYGQERVMNSSNISARETAFDQAWKLFTDHPEVGVGLNGFQVDPLVLSAPGEVVTPHNLWLGILAETGIVGGLGLLLFAITTVLNCFALTRRKLASVPGGRGAIWACLAILPFSLTFQILLVPTSILLIGFVAGTIRGMALADEGAPG